MNTPLVSDSETDVNWVWWPPFNLTFGREVGGGEGALRQHETYLKEQNIPPPPPFFGN